MTAESRAERAAYLASSYYEAGFHCGESVVKAVNEVAGHPLPPEVFRMASGFCEGISGSRCTCGALAGGVMALGILGGRESADEAWQPVWDATTTLRRNFFHDQGSTECDPISERHGGMRHPQRWAHCTDLVGRTAGWVVETAQENGWL
ncbi:MAG: C-GCAxxG-C-C family protein [Coriobacteriia bacterium]